MFCLCIICMKYKYPAFIPTIGIGLIQVFLNGYYRFKSNPLFKLCFSAVSALTSDEEKKKNIKKKNRSPTKVNPLSQQPENECQGSESSLNALDSFLWLCQHPHVRQASQYYACFYSYFKPIVTYDKTVAILIFFMLYR